MRTTIGLFGGSGYGIEQRDVKAAREKMPDASFELPYDGAKEMLLVDDVDNRDFLKELLDAMYDELPVQKKKKNVGANDI